MGKITEYLLVDGYNVIYDWEQLKKLADESLESARNKLIEILANYQGYKQIGIIVVFDAYKVAGGTESVYKTGNIDVVFTGEAETADSYIERVTPRYAKKYTVRVATSDHLEQVIILGKGAYRLSARELLLEVKDTERLIREKLYEIKPVKNNQLIDNLDSETAGLMERLRN